MKSKKRLTIITFIVSILSLVSAFKVSRSCIFYDISMALLGSAVLGFIMSVTEYYVERQKAMEEFWSQATKVLNELRKVKYLDEDAPINLIIEAFHEEHVNKWEMLFPLQSEDVGQHHEAKNNLIGWYEENVGVVGENDDYDKELEELYSLKMKEYKKTFISCMDSYRYVSSVELGELDNAYGNLDFIFANKRIRNEAYESIYNKIRTIIFEFRSEAYHFNLVAKGGGNLAVCAKKVDDLNQKYFSLKEETIHGHTNVLVFQKVFDDIYVSLEKFRCKIYRTKYVEPKIEPISGKMIYLGSGKTE